MISRRILPACFLMCSGVSAQPISSEQSFLERQLLAPLIQAGIRLDNPDELIPALNQNLLALPAALALGKLPPSPPVINALRLALDSPNETLVLHAARGLAKMGDRTWPDKVAKLAPKVTSIPVRMQMCGLLARAGNYSGWELIVELLVNAPTEIEAVHAFLELDSFIGMPDANGKPVDLPRVLSDLIPRMPASRLPKLQTTIQDMLTRADRERRGKQPR